MRFVQVTLTLVAVVGYAAAKYEVIEDFAKGAADKVQKTTTPPPARQPTVPSRPPTRPTLRIRPRPPPPEEPYSIDYTVTDNEGNSHFRRESIDEYGAIRGSYGYTNAQGLYRIVDFIADEKGYRATIRTNEPGVDRKEPANILLDVEEPPPGIQNQVFSEERRSGSGSYRRGSRGSYSG